MYFTGPRDKDCTRSGIRTSVSDEDFAEDELSISEKDRCSSRSIPGSLRSSGKTESPRILDSKDATNRMRWFLIFIYDVFLCYIKIFCHKLHTKNC